MSTTWQIVYEQLKDIMSQIDRTEEENDTWWTALNEIVRLILLDKSE